MSLSVSRRQSGRKNEAEICKYVDQLVEDKTLEELNNALIIEKGIIKDNKIIEFQCR